MTSDISHETRSAGWLLDGRIIGITLNTDMSHNIAPLGGLVVLDGHLTSSLDADISHGARSAGLVARRTWHVTSR